MQNYLKKYRITSNLASQSFSFSTYSIISDFVTTTIMGKPILDFNTPSRSGIYIFF